MTLLTDITYTNVGQVESPNISGEVFSTNIPITVIPFKPQESSKSYVNPGSNIASGDLVTDFLSLQVTSSEFLISPSTSITYVVPSSNDYTGSAMRFKPWYFSCVFALTIALAI